MNINSTLYLIVFQVLLFPAMKPEDNKPKESELTEAAAALSLDKK